MDSSSLQGEEANGFESEVKSWFVCVTFDQILELQGELWLVERAYCLAVSNDYFPCHSEILYCLL